MCINSSKTPKCVNEPDDTVARPAHEVMNMGNCLDGQGFLESVAFSSLLDQTVVGLEPNTWLTTWPTGPSTLSFTKPLTVTIRRDVDDT